MDRNREHFWKYSICLFLVAIVLVIIGAISLGRTSFHEDNRFAGSISAKENIAMLSDENLALKDELEQTKEKLDQQTLELNQLKERQVEIERFLTIEPLLKDKKYDEAKAALESVRKELLPQQMQQSCEEYAKTIEEKQQKSI